MSTIGELGSFLARESAAAGQTITPVHNLGRAAATNGAHQPE